MRKAVWAIFAVAGLGIALWIAASLLPSRERVTSETPAPRESHSASEESPVPAEPLVSSDGPSRTPATVEVEAVAAASWIVRGTVERGPQDPFPGARFRALLFDGYVAEGDPARDDLLLADEGGAFAWALPPPAGAVVLRFRAADSSASLHASDRLVAKGEGPPQDVQITLYPFDRFVEGTIADLEGRPLSGAEVFAYETLRVRTGEDGRYEIAVPSIGSQIRLTAQAPGFAQEDATAEAPQGAKRARVDFRLKPEFRITGTVRDESGRPIEGANVRTIFTRENVAVTGEDGRFTLGNLDPGRPRHMLYARREGFVETRVDVETSGVEWVQDLVLRRGARVEGSVFDPSGAPVAGARLFIGFSPAAYNRLDAISRDDGSFVFPAVPPGKENLVTQAPGFAPHILNLAVPEDGAALSAIVVRLEAGHFVGGTVRDPAGSPLEDVRVSAESGGVGLDRRTRTGPDGRFRLEALPSGEIELGLYHKGFVHLRGHRVAVDRDDLAFTLEPAGGLAGRVVDAQSGEPIATFRIRLVEPELGPGDRRGFGVSSSWVREGILFHEGAWDTKEEVLEAGRIYAVEASAEGYATGRLSRVVAEVEPSADENVIRLARGASITGEVLDAASGRPLSDATVKLASGKTPMIGWSDDSHGRPLVRTDAEGRFRIENVPVDEHVLVVDHADRAPLRDGPFEVAGGAVHRVVRLGIGAALGGVLLDAAGNPIAEGDVSLFAKSASAQVGRMWTARTDAQGGFAFERLPVGEFQVDHQLRRGWVIVSAVRTVVALSEGETKSIELRPRGSATIRGGVTSSETLPSVLPVSLMPARSPDGRGPLLDPILAGRGALAEGGAFEFLAVEPGAYRVLVSFHDETNRNWSGLASVSVAAGETADVTVEVRSR